MSNIQRCGKTKTLVHIRKHGNTTFYSRLKSLCIHNGFLRSTSYSITYPAATLRVWFRIQIWTNTEPQDPYFLRISPPLPPPKKNKNKKIANTTGGWKLSYVRSRDKADLSHWKRLHFSNPLRRPHSWNSFPSCHGLDPGIISHHTLRQIYDTPRSGNIFAAIGTPASTEWKVRRMWMTNLRGSDSGLSSHYHRIFLVVLRKPKKDLKKVIRNGRSCRHSYWAPTKQVPSIDVCSTPICSVYIVYTFTTTLHHPIYIIQTCYTECSQVQPPVHAEHQFGLLTLSRWQQYVQQIKMLSFSSRRFHDKS